jgi:hypothetical protein
MAHTTRGWGQYTPSNPTIYGSAVNLKCTEVVAGNNSQTTTPTPNPTSTYWSGHRNDLRASYGKDAANKAKDTCVCFNATSGLFFIGGTFADNEGNSYIVSGLRSERVNMRNFK